MIETTMDRTTIDKTTINKTRQYPHTQITNVFQQIMKEIENFLMNITVNDIRQKINDNNNEPYNTEPKFIQDKEGKYIKIKGEKFYEYKEGKEYTGYGYIYETNSNKITLVRIEHGNIKTSYTVTNENKETIVTKNQHYRNQFSTYTKNDMEESFEKIEEFNFYSFKIDETLYEDYISQYIIIHFTNLKTKKEDQMICRKYQFGITGLAYKKQKDEIIEIGFYEKGILIKGINDKFSIPTEKVEQNTYTINFSEMDDELIIEYPDGDIGVYFKGLKHPVKIKKRTGEDGLAYEILTGKNYLIGYYTNGTCKRCNLIPYETHKLIQYDQNQHTSETQVTPNPERKLS